MAIVNASQRVFITEPGPPSLPAKHRRRRSRRAHVHAVPESVPYDCRRRTATRLRHDSAKHFENPMHAGGRSFPPGVTCWSFSKTASSSRFGFTRSSFPGKASRRRFALGIETVSTINGTWCWAQNPISQRSASTLRLQSAITTEAERINCARSFMKSMVISLSVSDVTARCRDRRLALRLTRRFRSSLPPRRCVPYRYPRPDTVVRASSRPDPARVP